MIEKIACILFGFVLSLLLLKIYLIIKQPSINNKQYVDELDSDKIQLQKDVELLKEEIEKNTKIKTDYYNQIEKISNQLKEKEDEFNLQQNNYNDKLNSMKDEVHVLEDYIKEKNIEKEALEIEIVNQEKALDELQGKQIAINKRLRQKEKEKDEKNYNRIILSEEAKSDIEYLLEIEKHLSNKEILRKLIWTEYLQKPFNDMIGRMFGSKVPKNVIYCIQDDDEKAYIGKTSVEVSKRWTDHLKNSLGIGGIKKQKIHESLFRNWDKFDFLVLEEVKNKSIGDAEKYYIQLYETDKFGYNIKSGG